MGRLLGMNGKIYRTMPHAKLEMATILKYLLFLACLAANRVSVALKIKCWLYNF